MDKQTAFLMLVQTELMLSNPKLNYSFDPTGILAYAMKIPVEQIPEDLCIAAREYCVAQLFHSKFKEWMCVKSVWKYQLEGENDENII